MCTPGPHVRTGSIRRLDDASQEDHQEDHVRRRTDREEKAPSPTRRVRLRKRTAPRNRGVGGVGVLVNTHLAVNIDSHESLTSRIRPLRLKRRGSVPALTVLVVYVPTSHYDDEEVEAFYVELEKFYKEDHTFYKVIVNYFNTNIGP
ncbi:unnamed protein product [Heligmosomoides polygyrus]|uniref:Uncharacterized protein n=1 Tax=Heligmosomoides polygyrus TaxID=6339 RepID=A0A183F8J5_HELPZ|nr:unnamed protein product [Heligmosomoides polygyrus]